MSDRSIERLDQSLTERISKLFNDGHSILEAAKILGCNPSTLRRSVQRRGLVPPAHKRKERTSPVFSREMLETAKHLRKQGASWQSIADALGTGSAASLAARVWHCQKKEG